MIKKEVSILCAARIERGLSIEDAAKSLNVAVSTLYGWENGNRSPNKRKMLDISRLYGKNIMELFFADNLDKPKNTA
jgi:transcriptional regulator with XRE-family HTH domain